MSMLFDEWGNPMAYDPYSGQYVRVQQRQQQSVPAQQPASQNSLGMDLSYVATVQQIEQVQMSPNQRRVIMVQNEPVIAMKAADNMGLVTTDYYQLVKFDPYANAQTAENTAKYITEEQLEARLSALVESMQVKRQEHRNNNKYKEKMNNDKPTDERS